MHPSEFYICYTRELQDVAVDAANKYWEFGDTIESYKYSISELNTKFKSLETKVPISNLVKKHCFIGSSKHLSCPDCKQQHIVFSRTELQSTLRKKPEKCNVCYRKEFNIKSREHIKYLAQYVDNLRFPQNFSSTKNLSYIESIYLMHLLNEANDQGLIVPYNSIASIEFDRVIMDSLINKNFLFYFGEQLDEYSELSDCLTHFSINYHKIDANLLCEFETLKSRLPEFGLYCLIPANSNFEQINQELFDSLLINELSKDDLTNIENIIKSTLVRKALTAIQEVEKYHKIRVNKNEKFKQILEFAIWNFSMMQVNSMLHFQGIQVASDIHSGRLNYYNAEDALMSKVENYISYLKINPEAKKHFKNLPNATPNSRIETFTTKYIFENTLNWITLSGSEIMNRWITSPSINV